VINHPFVDGDERIAFAVVRVFLGLNRVGFDPPEVETVVVMEGVAEGALSAEELAGWIAKHVVPAPGLRVASARPESVARSSRGLQPVSAAAGGIAPE